MKHVLHITLPKCALSQLLIFQLSGSFGIYHQKNENFYKNLITLKVFMLNLKFIITAYVIPFTTNEENFVTANASAQYPLAEWKGLENDYLISCDFLGIEDIQK